MPHSSRPRFDWSDTAPTPPHGRRTPEDVEAADDVNDVDDLNDGDEALRDEAQGVEGEEDDEDTEDPDDAATDDDDDDALDDAFPLGDGVAEGAATVWCPYCGEPSAVAVDPGGGAQQRYVEDCPVCCRPWRVTVRYQPDGTAHVWAQTDDE